MTTLALNRKISFDYEILEKFEAGLALFGHEVKSAKLGRISLKGSYVTAKDSELFLTNANIPLYANAGNVKTYDPERSRKLLLKKKEIRYLIGKSQSEGLTLVPLRVYTKNRLLKLEFALAKGKKKFDKREKIKKRETDRDARRKLRRLGIRG